MRLSEAILLGLGEIEFTNSLWLGPGGSKGCKGCLAGAALFSVGKRYSILIVSELEAEWPWTRGFRDTPPPCPVCKSVKYDVLSLFGLASVLTHVAEHYQNKEISAEAIADWIHIYEPAEPEVTETETVKEEAHATA